MSEKMKRIKRIIIIAGILGCTVIIIGFIRLGVANSKAKKSADDTGISLSFEQRRSLDTQEGFLRGIYLLADWEQQTSMAIDDAFEMQGEDYKEQVNYRSGYASSKDLLQDAMRKQWVKMHTDLDAETVRQIDYLFGNDESRFDISRQALYFCYQEDCFDKIVSSVDDLEAGNAAEAYQQNRYALDEDWRAVPLDICYGLDPETTIEGCEESLNIAVASSELITVRSEVEKAETFEERYGVSLKNLSRAKSKLSSLEYAAKPEIPAVGMSVSEASSTKIGSPTRRTVDHGSWSHKKHTYGDLYWDKDGRQIFKAQYLDSEIKAVWDTRDSTASSPWRRSRNSYSSRASDPDDHDIESYYEDNRDEYDDYEDAYEGFLDDESEWDNY